MASTYIYDYVKFRPHFDTLAELTADTSLAYAATGNKYRVDTGDYVTAGTANYVVISSGGTPHETTAGGVNLMEAGPGFSTRARLVDWYDEGYTAQDGTIVSAAGVFYEADSGDTSIVDLNGWRELFDTADINNAYDLPLSYAGGPPTSSEVISAMIVTRAVDLPADFAGSYGYIGTNPTSSFVISVRDDGTEIGTITVSTGGTFTFATTSNTAKSIAAGSRLEFVAPSSADATAAYILATLAGAVA